jgi:hypothetical protein
LWFHVNDIYYYGGVSNYLIKNQPTQQLNPKIISKSLITYQLTKNNIMINLINKFIEALLVLLSIFVLGIFIPLLISIIVTLTTNATVVDCITFPAFWIISFIGWIIATVYINDVVNK